MTRQALLAALAFALAVAQPAAGARHPAPPPGIAPAFIPLPKSQPLPGPSPVPPAIAASPGKVYVMEVLQTGQLAPEVLQKLGPLNTLAEVEGFLKGNRIPFGWRIVEAPALALPTSMVQQIDKMPAHEVLVIPQKSGVAMAVVLEVRQPPAGQP
ncbi:MAG TPA: hypothetical protein VGC92_09390 [Phenylobacterium sp.]|jgi:hypothetical protein